MRGRPGPGCVVVESSSPSGQVSGETVPVTDVLACPHCSAPLTVGEKAATCATGHAFDRARGGYLNLLVGGRLPAGTTPGDTADALAARRRFLGAGHYAPVAAALVEAVGAVDGPLLDVGCGEGYYLSQMAPAEALGLDVSKQAVQMACRLLPQHQFVVGSAYRLPIRDASLAAVTSVFAPHPFEEFARVLQPGGRWVTVTPGPNHLQELRPQFTGEARAKALDRQQRRAEPPPEAAWSQRVRFELTLDATALSDLFFMTPIRWQAGAAAAVAQGDGRSVGVDVWVSSSTSPG